MVWPGSAFASVPVCAPTVAVFAIASDGATTFAFAGFDVTEASLGVVPFEERSHAKVAVFELVAPATWSVPTVTGTVVVIVTAWSRPLGMSDRPTVTTPPETFAVAVTPAPVTATVGSPLLVTPAGSRSVTCASNSATFAGIVVVTV